ncbi:DUF2256 domain-containing protein [Pseudoalteromonas tunicata]|uniref:Zinc finger protein n=1 Tax=Pseudoalteromonas tunicata D2 TaxID=87626 RepID=A4C6M2_9GAMM|nr:DUF2256 domain-containing protein [Pseudoalteromonas tunicata]ATC95600.1 hypothetical protein PTUN_a3231 [Pseudoalteromonas tunicata]AXT31169.1 DUF2256 domain-containing protein [Pseudoalteromonas tunicata]EAR29626.1 zinc finger protein [Pseudoalteromonas tunicata D2]MDP4984962.1 DUF2256 domain-containing protein [Pseudoalteromonas tunicata]
MTHHKQHLESKLCPICLRPFNWRKKWQRDWPNVKYCSKRCQSNAKNLNKFETPK